MKKLLLAFAPALPASSSAGDTFTANRDIQMVKFGVNYRSAGMLLVWQCTDLASQ